MMSLRAAAIGPAAAPILHDVDLQIAPGERVVLLGPSGAGKTTLINALWAAASPAVAYLPQPLGLVDPLSTRLNIALGRIDQRRWWRNLLTLIAMPRADRQHIEQIVEALELTPQLEQSVRSLSGGQRSRVALGRAIYRGADVLLADEPCSALDPRRAATVLDAMNQHFGTWVAAMHDVDAGLAAATRVLGIRAGRIVIDAPPSAALEVPLRALYAQDAARTDKPAPSSTPLSRGCL